METNLLMRWRTFLIIALPVLVLVVYRTNPPVTVLSAKAAEADSAPDLADFWDGSAHWVLEIPNTGLPVGESDTLDMGNGVFWSYLHASYQSAGVVDSCGAPVEFPGCVTRWVSSDGGQHFSLPEPKCLLDCSTCPCGETDHVSQQQYPRVARTPNGTFYMVYEHHAAEFLTRSSDGIHWERPWNVTNTGVWNLDLAYCSSAYRIGPHPFAAQDYDCMAGGPPGLFIDGKWLYIFVGTGQNPGHMGCISAPLAGDHYFRRCSANPLFTSSPDYGPLDALGSAANPYFDFRYATSADILQSDEMVYMVYEGIRGPSSPSAGGNDQFALGFARSSTVNGIWQKYPGNPILNGVAFDWGIGHADLIVINDATYMYTAAPALHRGRYVLVWNQ